ncbi:MAG: hemerythrin family protein, partial [Xanthomonadales bacterium]|nr:hemerythrin family protein [Xanthomonadales bacterium]
MDILDQQHRRYIDLLNVYLKEATEQLATENKSNKLKESFCFLLGYAAEHFSTEEEIMKEKDFPNYEAHRKEHLYFMNHVAKLSRELE